MRMRDLVGLLRDLLATRRRALVHLGLDLYVILLAGQRFLADEDKMERGLKDLVSANQGKTAQ